MQINFSVAWQSKLLKKRLLAMTFHGRPLYVDDEDFEFWTQYRFSQLARGKTVDEVIDETWEGMFQTKNVANLDK
jgi:hypothetical protein